MKKLYDVAIVGSGMAGSILGSILAKHHFNVILIDKNTHPRFAVGESMIPQTSIMLKVLAERYGVPELHHLSSFAQIHKNINTTCGIKRNFGFVYHRKNTPQNPDETNQSILEVPEAHLFRSDIDFYLFQVALQYGCEALQGVAIKDIAFDETSASITIDKQASIHARYVVDGSGFASVLAKKFSLRSPSSALKSHSRGIFTHMIDVCPYDDYTPDRGVKKNFTHWNSGTLHHVFDGGWMWVIPFNNHPDYSNRLCSVGLMLDPRRWPKTDQDPEQEFYDFLKDYPSIAQQFENAKAVRNWVSSGRIQYSSQKCIGDRFCLLSHAVGFIDPLYSRGLCNSTETINVLADRLMKGLKNDDLSESFFTPLDTFQKGLLTFNDRLVNSSFIAFKHYPLWNIWFRVWLYVAYLGRARITRAYLKYVETKDLTFLTALDNTECPGAITNNPQIQEFFERMCVIFEQFDERQLSEEQALVKATALLEGYTLAIPAIPFNNLQARFISTNSNQQAFADWMKKEAPLSLQEEYFDFNPDLLELLH